METDQTVALLQEIRDLHREHLTEYRRVTEQSLELQRRAVTRQQRMVQAYARIALPVVGVLMLLLVYLLVRWSSVLFR